MNIFDQETLFTANGLQPFTRYYPFFDGTSGIDIIPKLIEITMVSGSFQSSETVISDGNELFRICQQIIKLVTLILQQLHLKQSL